ncbi:MAG: hypothetical protein JF587_22335 [Catenulisporales bacterium]|nr:hypothetical protein [Catenulisporales bacterium]
MTSLAEKNAESARTRILAGSPAQHRVLIASATREAAPRPEPAFEVNRPVAACDCRM